MSLYDIEHALYALIAQAIVGFLTGEWFWGGVIPVAFFVSREHAQAEYRWIEHFANGKRANMPWWATLDKRVWDVHSLWWNLLCPVACVAAVFLAMR